MLDISPEEVNSNIKTSVLRGDVPATTFSFSFPQEAGKL
jgi:hypothetical protein